MPVARKYGPRQVATAALPNAQLTPEGAATATSEGAPLAEARARRGAAIAQLGQGVAEIGIGLYERQQAEARRQAEEARQRAIQLNVIEGENQLAEWEKRRLDDPIKGALSVRGRDAMELPEKIDEEFNKVAGEVALMMGTPEAKLAFERITQNRRERIGKTIRGHVEREIQTFASNELQARIANGIDAAIRTATTPDATGRLDLRGAATEIRAVEAAIDSQAKTLGLGPQQIDEQKKKMRSAVHEGVIAQLVADEKPDAARAYLAEARDDIDPERLDEVTKLVNTGSTRKAAQQETARILLEGGTLEEQRAKAKKIENPEVQDEVLARLEHENTVKERAKDEAQRARRQQAAQIVDKTKSIAAIPASIWSTFSDTEMSALRSYQKQLTEKGDVETDPAVYYTELLAARAKPLEWAQNTNLLKIIHKLGKTEFKQLADLQGDIIAGQVKKAEAAVNGYLSSNQVVQSAFGRAGIDTTPTPGTPEAERYFAIQRAVDERVAAWKVANGGKEPDRDVVQQIADDLLIDVVLQRGQWTGIVPFTSTPFRDVTKKIGEVTIADMPANLRKQAEDALRRAGRPVTESELLRLYREYLIEQSKTKSIGPTK